MKIKFRSPVMMLLCITLIFMTLLTVRPSVTYACSCVMPAEPLEALENSAAVFTGKVVDIKESKGTIISSADPAEVTFEVVSSWKGVETNKVKLTTELSSASCGFTFTEGESYIVYTGDGGEPEGLKTGLCTRTKLLSSAGEDLKELGPTTFTGRPSESPGTVADGSGTPESGRDLDVDSGSVANVYVWASAAVVVLLAIAIALLYRRKVSGRRK